MTQLRVVAVLSVCLSFQRALAASWTDAAPFTSTNGTNAHCSLRQRAGYTWDGLLPGHFLSYGDNIFSGFSRSSASDGNGAAPGGHTSARFITAKLVDSPSMSCDINDSFSISQMDITTNQDAIIETHYYMPDGAICKQIMPCSPAGGVFQNTQCGGARRVTFKLGQDARSDCIMSIKAIHFYCQSMSPSQSATVGTTKATGTCDRPPCSTSETIRPELRKHNATQTCVKNSCLPATSLTDDVAPTSTPHPTTIHHPIFPTYYYAPSCQKYGCPTLPASDSSAAGESTSSLSGENLSSSKTQRVPGPSEVLAIPLLPKSGYTHDSMFHKTRAGCPTLLPRCLNTWKFMSGCADDSSPDCFCSNEQYIKNVMGCIGAWSSAESEEEAATSYLIGICAAHVPRNPAIILAAPTIFGAGALTNKSGHVSQGGATAASTAAQVPYTTITLSTMLPTTAATSANATSVHGSTRTRSLITIVTVPRVQFATSTITVSGHMSTSIGLIADIGRETFSKPAGTSVSSTMLGTSGGASAGAGYQNSATVLATGWSGASNASSSSIVPATGGSETDKRHCIGLLAGLCLILAAF